MSEKELSQKEMKHIKGGLVQKGVEAGKVIEEQAGLLEDTVADTSLAKEIAKR